MNVLMLDHMLMGLAIMLPVVEVPRRQLLPCLFETDPTRRLFLLHAPQLSLQPCKV